MVTNVFISSGCPIRKMIYKHWIVQIYVNVQLPNLPMHRSSEGKIWGLISPSSQELRRTLLEHMSIVAATGKSTVHLYIARIYIYLFI